MKYKVFISYSVKDLTKITPYLNIMKAIPDVDCFCAKYDIEPTKHDREEILENIKNANVVFFFYSKHAKERIYINQEIGAALGSNRQILVGKLDKTKPAGMLEGHNELNFFNKRAIPQEIARLVAFLQKQVESHIVYQQSIASKLTIKHTEIIDLEAERIQSIIVTIMILCAIAALIYCLTRVKKA